MLVGAAADSANQGITIGVIQGDNNHREIDVILRLMEEINNRRKRNNLQKI